MPFVSGNQRTKLKARTLSNILLRAVLAHEWGKYFGIISTKTVTEIPYPGMVANNIKKAVIRLMWRHNCFRCYNTLLIRGLSTNEVPDEARSYYKEGKTKVFGKLKSEIEKPCFYPRHLFAWFFSCQKPSFYPGKFLAWNFPFQKPCFNPLTKDFGKYFDWIGLSFRP